MQPKGSTASELGREEFEKRVWKWKCESGDTIKKQMIRLGTSCDWSRERFTLDPGLSRAVRETFVRLYEKGLIYRGEYMVNWCPRCRTAISDLETVHEETQGNLWHIAYPVIGTDRKLVVATTRPETMLGDTAVAINPDDERYNDLHGKTVLLPLMNREIPIILDTMADPKFGTGVVKVTPAHDLNDFEAGRRHNLAVIKVIGEDGEDDRGRRQPTPDWTASKRASEIVADLEGSGPPRSSTEDHRLPLGRCQRCRTIVEPLVSTQWFVKTKPLAEPAIVSSKTAGFSSSPSIGQRPTSSGCTTSATGASRASSGGAIAFPPGIAATAARSRSRAKILRNARIADRIGSSRTPTCSTRGSAPGSGRSRRWAGPTRPRISRRSIRPRC